MEIKWYVFSETGPYKWQRHEESSGPYYERYNYFNEDGYDTEEEAVAEVSKYLENSYNLFFIAKGYSKSY